jgi:cold shock CspA family protein
MRTHGTLIKWNDGRGFGFIAVAGGREEIFVHISAFPRDGKRPQLNELISFETETTSDGKRRAARIMRPGQRTMPQPARGNSGNTGFRISVRVIAALVVVALGIYGYQRYRAARQPLLMETAKPVPVASTPQRYSCDGRTSCPEMRSCEEAIYFLKNCPNTTMDGDNDGVPCESQWCQ